MPSLVIVPCSKNKVWDKQRFAKNVQAKNVYIGTLFKLARRFAEMERHDWMILSAKYGLIAPHFTIPCSYDVSFNKPSSKCISLKELQAQVKVHELNKYDSIIVLGGKHYTSRVSQLFASNKIITPLEGLPIGKALAKLKLLTTQSKQSGEFDVF